ncbi:MAG: hypothetical protein NW200_02895 [Hyphomonadaceae bacterium]|nr:hypothetical protein [Hyphomonadaceae bacterium]
MTRIIRFRSRTLKGRVSRLHAVIDALDHHVTRMIARLEAGFRQLGPLLIALLAVIAGQALSSATFADSS